LALLNSELKPKIHDNTVYYSYEFYQFNNNQLIVDMRQ